MSNESTRPIGLAYVSNARGDGVVTIESSWYRPCETSPGRQKSGIYVVRVSPVSAYCWDARSVVTDASDYVSCIMSTITPALSHLTLHVCRHPDFGNSSMLRAKVMWLPHPLLFRIVCWWATVAAVTGVPPLLPQFRRELTLLTYDEMFNYAGLAGSHV